MSRGMFSLRHADDDAAGSGSRILLRDHGQMGLPQTAFARVNGNDEGVCPGHLVSEGDLYRNPTRFGHGELRAGGVGQPLIRTTVLGFVPSRSPATSLTTPRPRSTSAAF